MAEESDNQDFDWMQYSRRIAGKFLNSDREHELDHRFLLDDSIIKIMGPTNLDRCCRLEFLFPDRIHQHNYPVMDFDQAYNTYCAVESAKEFELMVAGLSEYYLIPSEQVIE